MNKWRLLASKIYRFFRPIDQVTMYRRLGVKIGEDTYLSEDIRIDYSHYWLVTIGKRVRIGARTIILTHDGSYKYPLGMTKLGLVDIQDDAFIGAGSIIMPGVTIGANSFIGAGSVVTKNIPPNSVAVGNPAKVIKETSELLEAQKKLMTKDVCFDESYTTRGNITETKMQEMIDVIKKYGYAFVE